MTNSEVDRLLEQFKKLDKYAKDYFSADRYEKVKKIFEFFSERILTAPASRKVYYHNCYPGGWLDHTLNVIEATMVVTKAFKAIGGKVDFTSEEAVFSAMFHDLGKLGDLEHSDYIEQTSDWHRERGELYIENPKLPQMPHADRSLYLLQHFGIEMTQKEWKTIKCHDGLYLEGNKSYFISYGTPTDFFTNLHHVVHWADMMSTVAEKKI